MLTTTPEQFVAEMEARASHPPDLGAALTTILPIVHADEKERFDTDTDPDGVPWPENRPSTVRKKGHARILEGLTGAMMAASISDAEGNIAKVESDGEGATLSYGVDTSVDKGGLPTAPVQQFGSVKKNIPVRRFIGMSDAGINKAGEALADAEMATWQQGVPSQ